MWSDNPANDFLVYDREHHEGEVYFCKHTLCKDCPNCMTDRVLVNGKLGLVGFCKYDPQLLGEDLLFDTIENVCGNIFER